ncbi:GNAT family N-acetyltransferase [Acuticoccus mangrovi]|uniref:GNAT family N-acetyltransferase n=1 Tax=Acuticoccus mangrovi TaxID=2796142 RepID=A0A934MNV6_9HYPH|nr:GNAT family N-acetyltransferase [Acuticoccus mangrovi]MBJ3778544.1 GNAT family N-acetyltransferase [Acuticoccus mangrovi]
MVLQFRETQPSEWRHGSFVVSTDRERLDVPKLLAMLRDTYWASDLEHERLVQAIEASLTFGLYADSGSLVGFCRVITDGAMFAYLRDVIIDAAYRRQGLGSLLTDTVLHHPALANVHYWLLATRDAHDVYKKFGFKPLENPGLYMVRRTTETPFQTADSGSPAADPTRHG